jgi:hypothetical protein
MLPALPQCWLSAHALTWQEQLSKCRLYGRSDVFLYTTQRPGSGADHSPPTSVEVKNGGAIPPPLHTSS